MHECSRQLSRVQGMHQHKQSQLQHADKPVLCINIYMLVCVCVFSLWVYNQLLGLCDVHVDNP